MDSLEVSAKTVEEAIEEALKQLGLPRNQVEVEILKRGKSGFLGLGSEEARVRVTPSQSQQSTTATTYAPPAQLSQEVLENLLTLMSITAKVESKYSTAEETNKQAPSSLTLDIQGNDLGILIGRIGQTLASLQHIVRLIVAHHLKTRVDLVVDVEGYKERRHQSLEAMALRLAERVASSKQSITLEPMPAYERRVVHLALADHPNVMTRSIGDEESRKVIIVPKR